MIPLDPLGPFIRNLERRMKALKIGPAELARMIGKYESSMYRIFSRQQKSLEYETLIRIASAVGMSLDELCDPDATMKILERIPAIRPDKRHGKRLQPRA